MLANTLLVRWSGGYLEVSDAGLVAIHGRLEAFLSLGDDVRSEAEAIRIAEAEIAKVGAEQVAVEAEYEETLGPVPYTDYLPGQGVTVPDIDGAPTLTEVVSITVTVDEEGNPIVQPELGTIDETSEKRILRAQRRLIPGSLAGRSESVMPLGSRGGFGSSNVPTVVATDPNEIDPRTAHTGFTGGSLVTATPFMVMDRPQIGERLVFTGILLGATTLPSGLTSPGGTGAQTFTYGSRPTALGFFDTWVIDGSEADPLEWFATFTGSSSGAGLVSVLYYAAPLATIANDSGYSSNPTPPIPSFTTPGHMLILHYVSTDASSGIDLPPGANSTISGGNPHEHGAVFPNYTGTSLEAVNPDGNGAWVATAIGS